MNIFVTNKCPITSARALDDKRVIKMILESAQIISTHMNLNKEEGPYKTTHKDHPVTKWTREESGNLNWLLNHFIALCREYTYRFNKVHKCAQFIPIFVKYLRQFKCPRTQTPFVNCTKFKDEEDVIMAYKKALIDKWQNDKRSPKWTNRIPPLWFRGRNEKTL